MKRARRADTNVLCVKYNKLTQPSNVHAGDVVTCSNVNCTAVLSYVSKVVAPSAGGSEGGHKVGLNIEITQYVYCSSLYHHDAVHISPICILFRFGHANFVVQKTTLI